MTEKAFEITRSPGGPVETFMESTPPEWLCGGRPGSTMDNRWFYDKHVLTLGVGETVDTDFSTIKRVR